jgi:hypothetical protein
VTALICIIGALAVVTAMWLATQLIRPIAWSDVGFVSVLSLAVAYLFISPVGALVGRSLPGVELRAGRYVLFTVYAYGLFLIPLIVTYAWWVSRADPTDASRTWVPSSGSSLPVLALIGASVVIRPLIATLFGLWRLRIGETVAERIVAVPTMFYAPFRALSDLQYPFVVLGIVVVAAEPNRRLRRIGTAVVGLHVLESLGFAVLNSRFSVLYLAVAAAIGLAQVHKPAYLVNRRTVRRLAAAGIGVYLLGIGVLATRPASSQGGLNILGDNQGLNRFNCADLIAQTRVLTFGQTPDPGIWNGYVWTVRRFIDPAGFNEFRLSLQTTAKSQIAARFLGERQLDYYSCVGTDAIGGLGPLGLLVAAVVIATTLAGSAWLFRRSTPMAVAAGSWLLFHVAVVDQEFGSLILSWTLKLPALAVMMFAGYLCGGRVVVTERTSSGAPMPDQRPLPARSLP